MDMPDPLPSGFVAIARGLYLEGLAYDAPRDVIWYSDVIAGGIHGVSPAGVPFAAFDRDRMWTGGILLNEDGAVLSSGAGGIRWNNPESGASGWLIRAIGGQPINGVNEMIPDGTGGIYFGTVDLERIAKGEATRPVGIYRLSVDGEVTLLADGLGFTNGMMLSADGKHLFCNETVAATCAFDVQPDLGLSNRRVILAKEDCDGMALDADGTFWVTGYKSSAIARIDMSGTPLADWPTPGGAVTQIRFGGADGRDVYLTTVPVDGGESLKVGELPDEKNSVLYSGRADVAGKAIPATRFALTEGSL
jgi:sugar lactone lactonase YvrE